MTKRQPSKANYLVFVLSLMLGAGMAGWGFIVLNKQKLSFQWPTTNGTIVQADRVYMPGRDSSHYRANVTYDYKVNGTRYVSGQISLWSSDLDGYDSINETFVTMHKVGTEVDVYYDPKNPANSVLLPGANDKLNELMMGAGGLLVVLGIIGIIARLRQEPRLMAVLNAPDAQTRIVQMRRGDIEKGIKGFLINLMIAMGFLMFAGALLLPPFLMGPAVTLEAQHKTNPSLFVWGIACIAGFTVFFVIGASKSRSAGCPVCRNMLNKKVFSTHQCSRCGTRIIFEGESASAIPAIEAVGAGAHSTAHPTRTGRHRTTITFQFRKDRFIDVAGLVAFPILFFWLWVGSEQRRDRGVGFICTILFSVLGCVYYFFPDSLGASKSRSSKKAQEPENKFGPYALDFGIILSAPVGLLIYLMLLTWQHQRLGKAGLIGVVIGFPVAVGIVTYICKQRFTRAQKLKLPKPPSFVPLTLLALWLVGTFIWVVFAVCLFYRLRA